MGRRMTCVLSLAYVRRQFARFARHLRDSPEKLSARPRTMVRPLGWPYQYSEQCLRDTGRRWPCRRISLRVASQVAQPVNAPPQQTPLQMRGGIHQTRLLSRRHNICARDSLGLHKESRFVQRYIANKTSLRGSKTGHGHPTPTNRRIFLEAKCLEWHCRYSNQSCLQGEIHFAFITTKLRCWKEIKETLEQLTGMRLGPN